MGLVKWFGNRGSTLVARYDCWHQVELNLACCEGLMKRRLLLHVLLCCLFFEKLLSFKLNVDRTAQLYTKESQRVFVLAYVFHVLDRTIWHERGTEGSRRAVWQLFRVHFAQTLCVSHKLPVQDAGVIRELSDFKQIFVFPKDLACKRVVTYVILLLSKCFCFWSILPS